MVVKDLTDKDKAKRIEVGDKVFSTKKWKDFLLISNIDKQNNINNILKEYKKDVWVVAEEVLQIKEISNIPKLKPKNLSEPKRENVHNQNIIIKVILSITHAIKLNKITKKIEKIYTHLKGNKHNIKININREQKQTYKDLTKELQNTLKKLRNENETITKKETGEFIKKKVDEIRNLRVIDPGKFFDRTQLDSVFSSQQLWTVDYEKLKQTLKEPQKII